MRTPWTTDADFDVVDRLLASPRYGERMAMQWLDQARYADTHGYHIDSGRDQTAWREWVIKAFNANMPFDQFTVEQLAGDLLPAPDGEPRPAGIHYEVVDAKLARSAKARAVLQTVFYSQLLADVQGIAPRWMHLALGNGEFASFKVNDFAAYERQTRRLLEAAAPQVLHVHTVQRGVVAVVPL